MKKRFLSALLAVVMVIMMIPVFSLTASAADASGTCGETATWTFDSTSGTLTISGTGAIENYAYTGNKAPWNTYKSNITKIEIADGITAIGNYAFYGCTAITAVDIPLSVVSIGSYAFNSCSSLVYISHNAEATLGSSALPMFIGGYTITLEPEYGNIKFTYCHVSPAYIVSNGDIIHKGNLIGHVGPKYVYGVLGNQYSDENGIPTNGATTGCHLHFGLRIDNKYYNPLDLFSLE